MNDRVTDDRVTDDRVPDDRVDRFFIVMHMLQKRRGDRVTDDRVTDDRVTDIALLMNDIIDTVLAINGIIDEQYSYHREFLLSRVIGLR